jgi:hypothetical protein
VFEGEGESLIALGPLLNAGLPLDPEGETSLIAGTTGLSTSCADWSSPRWFTRSARARPKLAQTFANSPTLSRDYGLRSTDRAAAAGQVLGLGGSSAPATQSERASAIA